MNRKGSYAAVIALIIVVVAVAVAGSSSAAVAAAGRSGYAGAAVEVKGEWQNFRYLLDKSSADSLADGTQTSGDCSVDGGRVSNYFDATITAAGNLNCEIVAGTLSIGLDPASPLPEAEADVTIDVELACSRELGGASVSYRKSAKFEKTVKPFDDSGNCLVDVLDT